MYNLQNHAPVKHQLHDIEPLEHYRPIITPALSPEDRMLLERALAALTTPMDAREVGAIADAIQARLARG